MKRMRRKGLSPVISVMLLIAIGLAIASILFFWAQGYLGNLKRVAQQDSTRQEMCDAAKVTMSDFCWDSQTVEKLTEGVQSSESVLKFVADSKSESGKIDGFVLYLDYLGGESVIVPTMPYSQVEGFKEMYVTTDVILNKENVGSLRVLPRVNVGENILACNELEKVISQEEIAATCA